MASTHSTVETARVNKSITFGTSFDGARPVEVSDIGGIIGSAAVGAKGCIAGSWTMYDKVQSSNNRVEEKKPSLKIVFHPLRGESDSTEFPEQVWVQVFSESDTMLKLAQLSVKKHINGFLARKSLSPQEFYIEFPHHLLGKLIGKKASGLNRLLVDAIHQNKHTMIDVADIPTAQTARLRINELKVDDKGDSKKLIAQVEARSNRCFLGWPPSDDDAYEEHISITVSFKRECEPFNDIQLYSERLKSVICDRVQNIKDQDEEDMDEINECLGHD